MSRTKKHLLHAVLVIFIILIALSILGDTSFDQITRSLPATTQTAAVADFNSSLVAHYTFDDGTATDSAGSHNGTLVGGPTLAAGKVGSGALQFDGADDVVTVSIPHSASGLSVSMWIKTNTSALQTLFSRGTASNGYVFRYIFGNRFDFGHDGVNDLSSRTNSFNTLASNTWYHVVMTWDGSTSAANVNFYKDGAVQSRDYTVDGASLSDVSGFMVSIGSTFNGTIDDVRVYNRALSAQEVSDLYTSGGGTVSSGGGTTTTTPPASTPANPAPPANPPANQTPPSAQSTVSAATCGNIDVQAAIDAVANQGVVLVPAGTCTWTKPVSATGKSLILKGAGIDQTTIIEDISPDGGALFFDPKFGELVRLTGFTFDGSKTIRSRATISVHGLTGQPSSRFRIDHNKFVNITQYGVLIYGAYGLIDHNTFVRTTSSNNTPTLVSVIGDPNSWSRPQDLGTSNAVFMEDNTFIHSIQANGPFDMHVGARYVFRNNTVYGNGMGHHGFDSDSRGVVNFEIYNNTITNASPTGDPYGHGIVFEFRSGSGVIFNNTVKRGPVMGNNGGYYDGFGMLRNYRSGDGFLSNYGYAFPWNGTPGQGVCDGNGPVDGNLPGMKGYPCKDQIGRTGGIGADGKQTFSPLYSWNNSFESGKSGAAVVGGHMYVQGYAPPPAGGSERVFEHIVEGRDYFNGVARPGYTPYTYPHPLATSGFTSDSGGPVITVPVGNPAPAINPPVITPPVTPPVVPAVIPPVVPQLPIVPAQLPVTPTTPTTPVTPAVPSLISRILPSFTSPTRTPTTPSTVTTNTRRTSPTGPFVPLPETTPEDISSTTPRTSIIATIKDIFSYVIERIWRGVERVMGR